MRPAPGRSSTKPPARIVLRDPSPVVDCGRHPTKRTPGERVAVGVDVVRDGHEELRAVVRWRGPGDDPRRGWSEAPLTHVDAHEKGVRWEGSFPVDRIGPWVWTVEAWADPLASWRVEVTRKVEARQDDLSGELSEGVALLRAAAKRARGDDAARIRAAAEAVADEGADTADRVEAALDAELAELCDRYPDRRGSARLPTPLEVDVDPVRARFGAWYELFPRSWGGLEGVREVVPELARLGFDVLYLPPIHPIGLTNRKGRNNSTVAGPDDPGSPYAIGDAGGGHTAVHPDLGTIEDFDRLVATAREHDIDVALDFAIQCSADHPWLVEHPEWFQHRPDGTLKYAENPPKKYQDIYNVDFDCADWRGLWEALRDIVLHWIEHGVTIFRVDNPHTKPFPFWEWMIGTIREEHPEVIFLAEAFTNRARMQELAKVGFDQSYTYFTWKHAAWELAEYVDELANGDERHYFRPNFFVNTPDILTAELATGGPPKFASRLVLAATLSPSYGIYSGFESYEHTPVVPGSEEYLDSEKYEMKSRSLDGPLLPLVSRLNHIRRENPALQVLEGIRFLDTESPAFLAHLRSQPGNTIITVVLLDPETPHEGVVVVPADLGLPPSFRVTDLLTDEEYDWRVGRNYIRLEPGDRPAHVMRVEAP